MCVFFKKILKKSLTFKLLFKKKIIKKNVIELYFIRASKCVQTVNVSFLLGRREYKIILVHYCKAARLRFDYDCSEMNGLKEQNLI